MIIEKMGGAYIFERNKVNALIRILDMNLHLIIIDVDPEDSDSVDFITLVHRLRPRIPLISIVAGSSEMDSQPYFEAGARYVVLKSVMENEISDKIHEFINGQKVKK